jgi:MFS family permease
VEIGGAFGWEIEYHPISIRFDTFMSRSDELLAELRAVVFGRSRWLDSLLPPLIFILLNTIFGFGIALVGALLIALLIGLYRLMRREPLSNALGGIGAVILAGLIARFVGGAEGYFLPGIISGAFTALLCLISVIFRRPLVAWTSYLTRRWPLDWYWHPKVRPAYSEVTIVWASFFALRTFIQYGLFQRQAAGTLGVVQLLTGWPTLILLLIVSYLYGMWRLQNLTGPSVDEFKAGLKPPWQGQKRGF